MYYNDDDRYEGDLKNDKIEGKGICYYNNGNRQEGEWKKDIYIINKYKKISLYLIKVKIN